MPEITSTWQAVPNPLLRGLIAIVLCLVAAAVFDVFVRRVMRRLVKATDTHLDDELLEASRRPIAVTVVAMGVGYALAELPLEETTRYVVQGVFVTAFLVFAVRALLRFTHIGMDYLARVGGDVGLVQEATLPLLQIANKVVIYGVALYCGLLAWEVDVTAWLASAGIVGIAVGFAAKDTLANLFAGVFILADRPYKLNDYLVLDSRERGYVTHIGIRTTRLLTRDDVEIIIPNSAMASARIVNQSGGPKPAFRVRCTIDVAYGSELARVREVLQQAAASTEGVLQDEDHSPRVRLRSFEDSGLRFQVMGWIAHPELHGRVMDRLNEAVYNGLIAAGVEIPYPKRDLYIRSWPGQEEEPASAPRSPPKLDLS